MKNLFFRAPALFLALGMLLLESRHGASEEPSGEMAKAEDAVRLIKSLGLTKIHWEAWETDVDRRKFLDLVVRDVIPKGQLSFAWRFEVVASSDQKDPPLRTNYAFGDGTVLNSKAREAFRQKAQEAIAAGKEEFSSADSPTTYRYAARVNFQDSCKRCHATRRLDEPDAKEELPKRVIFIELERKKEK